MKKLLKKMQKVDWTRDIVSIALSIAMFYIIWKVVIFIDPTAAMWDLGVLTNAGYVVLHITLYSAFARIMTFIHYDHVNGWTEEKSEEEQSKLFWYFFFGCLIANLSLGIAN